MYTDVQWPIPIPHQGARCFSARGDCAQVLCTISYLGTTASVNTLDNHWHPARRRPNPIRAPTHDGHDAMQCHASATWQQIRHVVLGAFPPWETGTSSAAGLMARFESRVSLGSCLCRVCLDRRLRTWVVWALSGFFGGFTLAWTVAVLAMGTWIAVCTTGVYTIISGKEC
ncbi:hypothetical protein F4861DRAFT_508283 [Xylaria intraflava]|nr:hypothetical protein F4861DRAFT_508283 [Xylaria intraflava]